MLCVIDDAQWLDDDSAHVLGFVARRLRADRVGILFATRDGSERRPPLDSLPELRLAALSDGDAIELLQVATRHRLDAGVAEQITGDSGGTPLAIMEMAGTLTVDQAAGRAPLPWPLPVGRQLASPVLRRVRELPP